MSVTEGLLAFSIPVVIAGKDRPVNREVRVCICYIDVLLYILFVYTSINLYVLFVKLCILCIHKYLISQRVRVGLSILVISECM